MHTEPLAPLKGAAFLKTPLKIIDLSEAQRRESNPRHKAVEMPSLSCLSLTHMLGEPAQTVKMKDKDSYQDSQAKPSSVRSVRCS